MNAYDTVLNAAADAAIDGLGEIRSGRIRSLSGFEEYVETRLEGILDFIMPTAKAEFASFIEPATQKAIDAVKPAMYEALRDWTPSIATIVGGMAGFAVLLGVWVSKRTFVRTRRAS